MTLAAHPTDPDKMVFKAVKPFFPEHEAQERLFDVLLNDDGQAWSEAERYLERTRPDLYQRLKEKCK